MADRPDITPELCRELIHYDPATGVLTWKRRPLRFFANERSFKRWNTKHAGAPALNCIERDVLGRPHRRVGQILGRQMKAHRAAWAIFHGRWPDGEIDHVNGDPTDNRICNLREVSRQQNMRNTAMHRDNRSGAAGVCWNPRTRKWTATLGIDGRRHYIGQYLTVEEASAARRVAQVDLGFHVNHGRIR